MREITVMFTDVRGFTTISEQFDPHGLTRFMNRFLTPMTDLILARQGTIDKYMGDAIMAFWNAPLPSSAMPRGPATRRSPCSDVARAQRRMAGRGEAAGRQHIPVNIGIGLNTGQASVGNFGSTQRFTYSCLGDDVNLASRLEGLCKEYRVGAIIGENTRAEVPDYATLELDLVMVKGKTEPERIFALLGEATLARSPGYPGVDRQQAKFLAPYRSAFRRGVGDIDACVAPAAAIGWQQGYYDMMRARIDGLIDDSPPDWTGVYVARGKEALDHRGAGLPRCRTQDAGADRREPRRTGRAAARALAGALVGRPDHRLFRAARRGRRARDRWPGRHRPAGRGARGLRRAGADRGRYALRRGRARGGRGGGRAAS